MAGAETKLLNFGAGLVALVVAWVALSSPWLSGTYTIPWDGKAHFAPQVQFLAACIARGEWPWWTPNVFAGHPQIADPQSMIFSPPMLALAVLNPSPSLWAIDTTVLATVLFGGVGVMVYAHRHGWHWAAALIAALVFTFGGSMAWRLQHFGQVMSLSYLPWAIVFVEIAVRRGHIWAGAAAGVFAAVILLGRDQVGLLSIYLLIAFALWCALNRSGRKARIVRALPAAITGLAVGALIVAIPLALTLALAAHSNRPSIDFAGAGAGSLHPGLLITALFPNLYGAAGDMANYWGPPSLVWENTGLFIAQNMGVLYIGVLPLMAIAIAGMRGWLADREIAFFATAAIVLLFYALGWFTPVFRAAYELVPGIDKFRRPADATFLVGAMIAFVAGWSVHRIITAVEMAERPVAARAIVALAAAGLVAAVAIAVSWDRLEAALPPIAIGLATITLTVSAAALAFWVWPIRPVLAGAMLVAVVAADLSTHNGPNGANALRTSSIDMLQPDAPHPTIAKLKTLVAANTNEQYRPRVELVGLGYHWPNASLTHGLENTLGANPVRLAWYDNAIGGGDTVAKLEQRDFSRLMPSYTSTFARMLGLQFIASGIPIPTENGPGAGLQIVATDGGNFIYEVPSPLPRVAFATEAVADGNESSAAVSRELPDLDYTRAVLLSDVRTIPKENITPRDHTTGWARIRRYMNAEVVIEADSMAGGWVVLHDVWHPWWEVTVDGRPAELLRANRVFRAVEVPAGRHVIEFKFKPLRGLWKQLVRTK